MVEKLKAPIFVARQPIFDRNLNIWGYELLFRNAQSLNSASIKNGEYATSKVILDGFPIAQKGVKKDVKFLINFTEKLLLEEVPFLLPKDKVIVEVLEVVSLNKEILKLCIKLKKNGYTLALDDFTGEINDKRFFYIFDIVKLEIPSLSPDRIKSITSELKSYNCKVLAEKIEDKNVFELTKKIGCDLFQGYFFSKPQLISGTTISSTQLSKIKLLSAMSQKETLTPEKLTDLIKSDLSLTYKLLQFINSAAFSFVRKINSIRDAINYLGLENVTKWCMIFLLTHLNPTNVGMELVKLSVQRAYFLENLYPYVDVKTSSDNFFLLGMFSKLDAILNMPIEKALKEIKIDPIVFDALTKGNELTIFLKLLEDFEQANWTALDEILKTIGISEQIVSECYLKAFETTSKFYI